MKPDRVCIMFPLCSVQFWKLDWIGTIPLLSLYLQNMQLCSEIHCFPMGSELSEGSKSWLSHEKIQIWRQTDSVTANPIQDWDVLWKTLALSQYGHLCTSLLVAILCVLLQIAAMLQYYHWFPPCHVRQGKAKAEAGEGQRRDKIGHGAEGNRSKKAAGGGWIQWQWFMSDLIPSFKNFSALSQDTVLTFKHWGKGIIALSKGTSFILPFGAKKERMSLKRGERIKMQVAGTYIALLPLPILKHTSSPLPTYAAKLLRAAYLLGSAAGCAICHRHPEMQDIGLTCATTRPLDYQNSRSCCCW